MCPLAPDTRLPVADYHSIESLDPGLGLTFDEAVTEV